MPGSATAEDMPIHTPPGFDLRPVLARLNSSALRHSGEYRRAITRTSPVLFSLVYLLDHMAAAETGGVLSLSQLHLDMARAARRWVRRDIGPAQVRDAWIAPRGSGKSSWTFLVLPLWALAHQHRRFVTAFADSGPQARQHLANLKRELDANEPLRLDFPELCRPARLRGRSDTDTQVNYLAESGAAIMAKGIDSSLLGAKSGSMRPDLIVGDDLEPAASNYSAAGKAKRLATLVDAVFGMNPNAVVQLAGTVTMHGSLMHDLVRAALGDPEAPAWVADERIVPRYYPAIVTDPETGEERSLWPQRWPLGYLQSIRHTRNYALNFANLPPSAGQGFWEPDDIVVDPRAAAARRVLTVDPAVTHGTTSDETGLAVVGMEPGPRGRAVVEWARGVRVAPKALRRQVLAVLARNPSVRLVKVEANQGGDVWREALEPLPAGVELVLHKVWEPKSVRFTRALDWYQRGWIVHSRELPALTDQQLAYPNVAHDDVLDAVVAGLEHWLSDRDRGEEAG